MRMSSCGGSSSATRGTTRGGAPPCMPKAEGLGFVQQPHELLRRQLQRHARHYARRGTPLHA